MKFYAKRQSIDSDTIKSILEDIPNMKYKDIASKYGVSYTSIIKIANTYGTWTFTYKLPQEEANIPQA